MIIEKLHWNVRFEWDKLNNSHKRYLSDPEVDRVLNLAISDYVTMFTHGTNIQKYRLGFEVNQQRLDMLQTLVISLKDLNVTKEDDIYIFNLESLSKPYFSYLPSNCKIKYCTPLFGIEMEKHLNSLGQYHTKPSKLWKRVIGRIRQNSLVLYTNDEFEIETLNLNYIKKPNEVCLGTYPELTDLGGANKGKVECDLPDDYHNLIVTIAVQNLQRIFESPTEQFSDKKILNLT